MGTDSSHNQVNLARLLRRLEKAVETQDWSYQTPTERSARWVQAEGMLQSTAYAKQLLLNIKDSEGMEPDRSIDSIHDVRSQYLKNTEAKINHVESVLAEIKERSQPQLSKPPSFLSHIPAPQPKPVTRPEIIVTTSASKPSELASSDALLPADDPQPTLQSPEDDLLPSTPAPQTGSTFTAPEPAHLRAESLLPDSRPPAAAPQISDTPAFMHTSLKTQEDLSEQLAQMAAQLKRNAQSFAAQLHEDNALVQLAHDQLEGVHTRVKTERTTLRDFRGKSGYTTCMVMGAVAVVMVSWVMMFFLIKVT
ncbi:Use1 domain-containing protein [Ceratobasidium sp. AG-Ba]|nr:Use1 domain-containing protein [Ceratobasidium sp. AG-Ba]